MMIMNNYNMYTIEEVKNIYNNEILVNVPDDAKIARSSNSTSIKGNLYDTGDLFKRTLKEFIDGVDDNKYYLEYASRYISWYYNWKKNGNFEYKKENEYETCDSYIDEHDKRNYTEHNNSNFECGKYVKSIGDVVM